MDRAPAYVEEIIARAQTKCLGLPCLFETCGDVVVVDIAARVRCVNIVVLVGDAETNEIGVDVVLGELLRLLNPNVCFCS
jgi:hypothetical protein